MLFAKQNTILDHDRKSDLDYICLVENTILDDLLNASEGGHGSRGRRQAGELILGGPSAGDAGLYNKGIPFVRNFPLQWISLL